MMSLEKDLTPDQVAGIKELGHIKRGISEEAWLLLKTMMLAYASGLEAGMELERGARGISA